MELVTLTRTLDLNKGQRVNIYTDSKYAYLILHVHATIRKEKKKEFKTTTGKPIKRFRDRETFSCNILS